MQTLRQTNHAYIVRIILDCEGKGVVLGQYADNTYYVCPCRLVTNNEYGNIRAFTAESVFLGSDKLAKALSAFWKLAKDCR